MAARTAGTVTVLRQDGGTVPAAAQSADTANGNVIFGSTGGATATATAARDFRTLYVLVAGTSTVGTCTIRATGNGVDAGGNAQTSPYPSNAVFTQGSQGDLVITYNNQSVMVGPLTSDRFLQPDGNIYLDWNAVAAHTFQVFQTPFNVV